MLAFWNSSEQRFHLFISRSSLATLFKCFSYRKWRIFYCFPFISYYGSIIKTFSSYSTPLCLLFVPSRKACDLNYATQVKALKYELCCHHRRFQLLCRKSFNFQSFQFKHPSKCSNKNSRRFERKIILNPPCILPRCPSSSALQILFFLIRAEEARAFTKPYCWLFAFVVSLGGFQ